MEIKKIVLIFLFLIAPVVVSSQSDKLSEIIVTTAEQLAEDELDTEASGIFIEKLYDLTDDPVLINSGDENELSRLFFLSDFQIRVLIDYVHTTGRIISPYEIANIPGFDKETVEIMIPFITLDNKLITGKDSANLRNNFITNFYIKPGSSDSGYVGSSCKVLTRYKFTSGSFLGGFTSEKDPGEKFIGSIPYRPDFTSAYLTYRGSGIIRKIIIGDYSVRFGQGTNINTGISTGYSLTAQGYLSGKNEIKPYTSTDENNFFRGIAVEFFVKNLDLSVFYSKNRIDATLNEPSDSSDTVIRNFYNLGLHNTPQLLLKKDVATETNYAINLLYNFTCLRLGVAWSETRFSLPVKIERMKPENIYDFEGNFNRLCTVYYNCLFKRIIFSGEFSMSRSSGYALVEGVSMRPSDRLNINFLYFNFSPGFISFHGKGPGVGSGHSNEQGILGNFTFEAAKYLFISAGSDIRIFPWLKYRCSAPSREMKDEIRIKYLPLSPISIDASFNYKFCMVNSKDKKGVPGQQEIVSRTVKGSVKYSPNDKLTLGTRIDYKLVDPSGRKGMLLLQDINYRFSLIPVTLWLRYCIFNTADYESRLYTWENDLLYGFSIPALYGRGSRTYIMAGWKLNYKTELRVKYSISTWPDSLIPVADNEEFRIQVRINM